MNAVLEAFALILLLSVAIGLLRVWQGPGFADRMLAAQLLGTTGVAILLLLAAPLGLPALLDVALVLALLALLAVLAFVARLWDPDAQDPNATSATAAARDEASGDRGTSAGEVRR
jgi:multicomponent Na+:H+ antiporter subunit F